MRSRPLVFATILVCTAVGHLRVTEAHPTAMECDSKRATIKGTPGPDRLRGTPSADVIAAGAGNDSVVGGDGKDVICGGAGDDTITGSGGRDSIFGGSGDDDIRGASGSDLQLSGEVGNDTLSSGPGNFQFLSGGEGDDRLLGSAEVDLLLPGAGNDVIEGAGGEFDRLLFITSSGPVDVDLERGSATGEGADTFTDVEGVNGSVFDDVLSGDDKTNLLAGGPGNDSIVGRDGLDIASYVSSSVAVHVDLTLGTVTGDGSDTLDGVEGATGSEFADELLGSSGPNVLMGHGGDDAIRGESGDDFLLGNEGDDVVDGGPGRDLYDFVLATNAIEIDLATSEFSGEGNDHLTSFEEFVGSEFDDTLSGTSGDDVLLGEDGDDVLLGGSGTDGLDGMGGNDEVQGQEGEDVCYDPEDDLTGCETVSVPTRHLLWFMHDAIKNELFARLKHH